MEAPFFQDRADAAKQLIAALPPDIDGTWLVLGLPRGGVPIAAAIAQHLGAELGVVIVRKVGAPGNPELAVAAITGPGEDEIAINRPVQKLCGLSDMDVRKLSIQPVQEVEARRRLWVQPKASAVWRGRDILIVDDGAATGTTLEAAVAAVKNQKAKTITVALPVALSGALDRLDVMDVRFVCLHRSDHLASVGGAYNDFPQVSDQQVSDLLSRQRVRGVFQQKKYKKKPRRCLFFFGNMIVTEGVTTVWKNTQSLSSKTTQTSEKR